MTLPLLLADDDSHVLRALRLLMKNAGLACDAVDGPDAVLAALKRRDYAVLLMDMNYRQDTTSGEEGLALISAVRELDAGLPIVVMTGWGSVPLAVEAMRRGADDFVEKPWDNTRLLTILRNLSRLRAERRASARLSAENALLKSAGDDGWIAESPLMRQLMQRAATVAASDINVLLTGENGTGKSQLAAWMHRHSARAARGFINVNTGAIPGALFESELFGHVKGAFTDAREGRIGRFELADGGTLFLDEVGNLPPEHQAKLLRVLEGGEFERVGSSRSQRADVRVIAATNADLNALVQSGRFRQDLYYRLNGIELRLPSLRERDGDALELARHFLRRIGRKYGRDAAGFDAQAERALATYPWPGNVRELRHCIERALLLATEARIGLADLALPHSPTASPAAPMDSAWEALTLEEAEQRLLALALRRHGGHANAAAEALGLSRSAFYRRLEKHRP